MTTDAVRRARRSSAGPWPAPPAEEYPLPQQRSPGSATPRLLFPLLVRDRLLARLSRTVSSTPLTLVWAPAGAGKTSLALTWVTRLPRSARLTWVGVDPHATGSAAAWSQVGQALHRSTRPRLVPEGDAPARRAADLDVVVIDNGEALADEVLADLCEHVLSDRHVAPRVVLLTRAEPRFPLHRHRVDGSVVELRNDDLAFSGREVRDLLRLHDVPASDATARLLLRRTGGWAAGVRMAALAMQGTTKPMTPGEIDACLTPSHNLMADYLVAEVLQPMTEHEKDVLVSTCLCPELDPALVHDVTGEDDAENLLLELSRRHAFVQRIGGTPPTFRVHPLLRQALYAEATHGAPAVAAPPARPDGVPTGGSQLGQSLSAKELEVLEHLAALLTTEEIASAMFISVNTVKTHVRSILRKLAVSRRNQAVRRARQLGLV
jgi:LuxR family transcriptional regulator, maltose regulon positive regulatory protein